MSVSITEFSRNSPARGHPKPDGVLRRPVVVGHVASVRLDAHLEPEVVRVRAHEPPTRADANAVLGVSLAIDFHAASTSSWAVGP